MNLVRRTNLILVALLAACTEPLLAAEALHPGPTAPPPCPVTRIAMPCTTGTYKYDAAGNIVAMGNDTFAYDAVSRLTSASLVSAGKQQSFNYDIFGNLTSITGPDPWPQPQPDANTNRLKPTFYDAAGNPDIRYDGAGNMTSWGGVNYTYDATNMVTTAIGGNSDARYIYDAADERVGTVMPVRENINGKVTASSTRYMATWRLRDLGGRVIREFSEDSAQGSPNWSWTHDYVYRGAQLLAEIQPDTAPGTEKTWHYHLDHLGTPRLVTTDSGSEVSEHNFFPFGKEITDPVKEVLQFTGHERDTAAGQYYMHARYDNTIAGRFLSVDPVGGDISRSQSWNRYIYGANNPVTRTDPFGLSPCPPVKGKDGKEHPSICVEVVGKDPVREAAERNSALREAELKKQARQSNGGHNFVYKYLMWGHSHLDPIAQKIHEIDCRYAILSNCHGVVGAPLFMGPLSAPEATELTLLKKSLASEAQLADAQEGIGRIIAGAEGTILRDAPRLEAQYGPGTWVKMSTWGFRAADGHLIETHFYKNILTGQVVEFKSTLPWH